MVLFTCLPGQIKGTVYRYPTPEKAGHLRTQCDRVNMCTLSAKKNI